MKHLKRFGIGLLISATTFGLGYGLTDVAFNVRDFGVVNASMLVAKGLAITIVAYIVGWTVVGK